MNILSTFFVAVSLSMDNMAVALAAGCGSHERVKVKRAVCVSVWFAVAHFVMFSLGFLGGYELVHCIGRAGLWVACLILMGIGTNMVWGSLCPSKCMQTGVFYSLKIRMMLAFATSVDALLVGLGLGLAGAPYWLTVIGVYVCVFVSSVCAFYAGSCLGQRFGPWAERLGGIVLMALGVKLLL